MSTVNHYVIGHMSLKFTEIWMTQVLKCVGRGPRNIVSISIDITRRNECRMGEKLKYILLGWPSWN